MTTNVTLGLGLNDEHSSTTHVRSSLMCYKSQTTHMNRIKGCMRTTNTYVNCLSLVERLFWSKTKVQRVQIGLELHTILFDCLSPFNK